MTMDAKELRELLKSQRNQKFRKRTEAQLQGDNRLAEANKIRNPLQAKDPEWLRRNRAGVAKTVSSALWQERVAKANKEKWADPEWAKFMNERWHSKDNDPERIAKISKAKTQWWSEGNRKDELSKKSKELWKDPEYVEKVMIHQRVPVSTPYGDFKSCSEFKAATGFAFNDKRRESPHLYYETSKGPGKPTYQDVCITPLGEFQSRSDAFDAHKNANDLCVPPKTQKGSDWRYTQWWNNVARRFPDTFCIQHLPKREWNLYYKNDPKNDPKIDK